MSAQTVRPTLLESHVPRVVPSSLLHSSIEIHFFWNTLLSTDKCSHLMATFPHREINKYLILYELLADVNLGTRKPRKADVTEVGCNDGNLEKKKTTSSKVGQQHLIRRYKPGLDLRAPTEQAGQGRKTGPQNHLSAKTAKEKARTEAWGER